MSLKHFSYCYCDFKKIWLYYVKWWFSDSCRIFENILFVSFTIYVSVLQNPSIIIACISIVTKMVRVGFFFNILHTFLIYTKYIFPTIFSDISKVEISCSCCLFVCIYLSFRWERESVKEGMINDKIKS